MRCESFAPVWRPDARALILGTMPSVASLEAGQYYAHPRNAFWHIVYDLWETPFEEDYAARLNFLTAHGAALWDVAKTCRRPGSLDADMREIEPNEILALIRDMPQLRRVLCNGQTAGKLLRRFFESLPVEVAVMPSTSPAYTLPYARKLEGWGLLRRTVEG